MKTISTRGRTYPIISGFLLVALLSGANSSAAEDSAYEKAYQAGQELEKGGKFAEARGEFEKALAVPGITPDQAAQAMMKMAGTFLSVRKAQDAINILEKARTLSGISNQTKIQANLLFGQTGLTWSWQFPWLTAQAKDAFSLIIELPEITPEQSTAAHQGMVKAFMGLKQYADARAVMAKLVSRSTLNPAEKLAVQKEIGLTCMLEKKYPEARTEMAKVLSMEGLSETDKVDVQLQLGLSYYYEKDFEHAKPELQKVLTMPTANDQRVRLDGWIRTIPSIEAKLRLRKIDPTIEKEKSIAVLFIGCSMTMRGMMPHVVEKLAASAPADRPRIIPAMHTRGGTRLDVHWKAGQDSDTARGMIAEELWDVVVLDSFNTVTTETLLDPAKLFADFSRNRNIKPILYESQPVQATPFPEGYQKYHENNVALGKALTLPLAPIPLAQMHYLAANPTAKIGMFYDDWIHPTEKSVYLAACCIYATITGYSPVGLSNQNLPEAEARNLQEAAWKAVQEANPDLKPWR